ncbi:hypothetical protein AKO1_001608 [Acrasis kona]|uniref:Microtubule-associated protein Jupiter n=1 Tax=Acrasis kona TaxID=1008807 RepID=A0AAW2ZD96_9EUKA
MSNPSGGSVGAHDLNPTINPSGGSKSGGSESGSQVGPNSDLFKKDQKGNAGGIPQAKYDPVGPGGDDPNPDQLKPPHNLSGGSYNKQSGGSFNPPPL